MDCNSTLFQEVRNWVYRNGRRLECNIWDCLYENGSKEKVIDALLVYQNEDGGFGHAIEPDNWNPESSPYSTLQAVDILRNIHFMDMNHPIYQGIIRYFDSGDNYNEDGWCFSIPSNDNYPHAPWWNYNIDENKSQNIGLTAQIVAFILESVDKQTALYQTALELVPELMTHMMSTEQLGDMGVGGFVILLDVLGKVDIGGANLPKYQQRLRDLVNRTIERDTSKWEIYGARPLNYITSPQSSYYEENKAIVQAELDYLIETRPEHGVWPINWTWYDNMEQYGTQFAISENWWKASKAIEKLRLLEAFNKL